ncbi:MAG TPA: hypothetical protein VFN95_10060, partial [Flavitalea sp.]|nr:hypothetical protein [Flavitalea sp.]
MLKEDKSLLNGCYSPPLFLPGMKELDCLHSNSPKVFEALQMLRSSASQKTLSSRGTRDLLGSN